MFFLKANRYFKKASIPHFICPSFMSPIKVPTERKRQYTIGYTRNSPKGTLRINISKPPTVPAERLMGRKK